MTLLARLDAWWYHAVPASRLAMLRVAVGAYALVYCLVRFPALTAVTRFHASEFAPTGPVVLLDAPLTAALVYAPAALAIIAGAAFVFGFRYALSGPAFALLFLWVTSYRSSWGMKFHTENLVALHLLLLAVVPAADALSLDARGAAVVARYPHGRYGWAIRAMCVVTVIAYVLAGVAKLRLSGGEWVTGEILRAQVAYDNLRKIELGSLHSPLGAALVSSSWLFRALAWITMLVELGAPVALLGRRPALFWVLAAFSFHVGVVALMAIAFPYQLSFVAYLSFFEVERVQGSRPYRFLRERLAWLAKPRDHRAVARH